MQRETYEIHTRNPSQVKPRCFLPSRQRLPVPRGAPRRQEPGTPALHGGHDHRVRRGRHVRLPGRHAIRVRLRQGVPERHLRAGQRVGRAGVGDVRSQ